MESHVGATRWILVAAALALVASACASQAPEGSSPEPAAPASSPPPAAPSPDPTSGEGGDEEAPPPEVPRELRFTAPALGGGTIDGADYAGRDLVIWFWAPW